MITDAELKVIFNRKKEKINRKAKITTGFKITTFELFINNHFQNDLNY